MKLLWGIGIPYEIPSSTEGVTFVGGSQLIIAVELEDGTHVLAEHFSDDPPGEFQEIAIDIQRAKR